MASVTMALDSVWNSSCNTGEVCNWRNAPYAVPLAATGTVDSNYAAGEDVYPNTGATINDSVSSIRNLKTANDVIWYEHLNHAGGNMCVNVGWQNDQLGGLNDQFTSHLFVASNICP